MAHSHAQIVAWLLPLVAPVAPALRDAAHHNTVDERLEALQAAAQCGLEGMVAVEAAMTAIRLAPGEAPPALTGVQLIAEERQRQIDAKGFTPDVDIKSYLPKHKRGELALAAIAYADNAANALCHEVFEEDYLEIAGIWPWHPTSWNPKNPRTDLIKAGALIAAQIDLMEALEAQKAKDGAV